MNRFGEKNDASGKNDATPGMNPQAGWGMYGQAGWNPAAASQYQNWAQYQSGTLVTSSGISRGFQRDFYYFISNIYNYSRSMLRIQPPVTRRSSYSNTGLKCSNSSSNKPLRSRRPASRVANPALSPATPERRRLVKRRAVSHKLAPPLVTRLKVKVLPPATVPKATTPPPTPNTAPSIPSTTVS